MAASRKPKLSKPHYWGREAAPKVYFIQFGSSDAACAILYTFVHFLNDFEKHSKNVHTICASTFLWGGSFPHVVLLSSGHKPPQPSGWDPELG